MKNQPQPNRPPRPRSSGRKPRRDPLGYTPLRIVPGGAEDGPPARPTGRRRRGQSGNRRRVPPAVVWNRRVAALGRFAFTVLVLESVFLLLASPLLEVQNVTVDGATIRSSDKIIQTAGLQRPGNIFRAPVGRAETRLAGLPEVHTVRVERRLPRTLAIVVTERRPMATVMTQQGCWWMDEGGLIFRQVGKPLGDRPILALAPRKITVGQTLPLVALSAALNCLEQLPGLPLARNVRLHVDEAQEAWLNNPDGFKVRLGPLDNAPERLTVTARLLNGPDGPALMKKAIALDMTTPNSEVYRPRRGGA